MQAAPSSSWQQVPHLAALLGSISVLTELYQPLRLAIGRNAACVRIRLQEDDLE